MANSSSLLEEYQTISNSIIQNKSNWGKDMRYMIPAYTNFCIAMIYKYPDQIFRNT